MNFSKNNDIFNQLSQQILKNKYKNCKNNNLNLNNLIIFTMKLLSKRHQKNRILNVNNPKISMREFASTCLIYIIIIKVLQH